MSKESLFIFIICFWTILTIFSNVLESSELETSLTDSKINDYDINTDTKTYTTNVADSIFGLLDDIPIIKYFVPLMKIMSFSYGDIYPPVISTFLIAMSIFTVYVVVGLWRGG